MEIYSAEEAVGWINHAEIQFLFP